MTPTEDVTRSSRWTPEDAQLERQLRERTLGSWTVYGSRGRPIQLRVWFTREDGGFSVVLPDLPGVASQGGSLDEARNRIVEAFAGALSVYRAQGCRVPWERSDDDPPGETTERWLVVDG